LYKSCQSESYHSIKFPSVLTVVTVILPKTFIVVSHFSIPLSYLLIPDQHPWTLYFLLLGHTAVNGILFTSQVAVTWLGKRRKIYYKKTKKSFNEFKMSQYDLLLGSGQLECFLTLLAFFIPWRIDNINHLNAANVIGDFIYFISVVLKVIVFRFILTVISM